MEAVTATTALDRSATVFGLAVFAAASRAKAIALCSATAGIGAGLGLVIGGALADWVSWRAGLFLNVPIGIAVIVLAPRSLQARATTLRPDPG